MKTQTQEEKMKKYCILFCAVISMALTAGTALAADSIQGRLGVTGRIGFLVPSNSEAFTIPNSNLNTDIGFIGGGGFIYGINKNIAAELDITHTGIDAQRAGSKAGNFDTINISLGGQYRFVDIPVQRLVPYAGAGLDILLNSFSSANGTNADVDNTVGGHVSGGVDYFLMRQLALNTELKGLLAPNADIKFEGTKIGNYDPTSFSMTFGVRYFFN
jgi:outer membrane protein